MKKVVKVEPKKPIMISLVQYGLHLNRSPYVKWPETIEAVKAKIKEISPGFTENLYDEATATVIADIRRFIQFYGVTVCAAAAQLSREKMGLEPSITEDGHAKTTRK